MSLLNNDYDGTSLFLGKQDGAHQFAPNQTQTTQSQSNPANISGSQHATSAHKAGGSARSQSPHIHAFKPEHSDLDAISAADPTAPKKTRKANPYLKGLKPKHQSQVQEALQDAFGTLQADEVGALERPTQDVAIAKLQELGYRFLGNKHGTNNSNIDVEMLTAWLQDRKDDQGQPLYTGNQIAIAIGKLESAANDSSKILYHRNKDVHGLLMTGVGVKTGAGEQEKTVRFIDWHDRKANDFSFAEEVTLEGKRPKHGKRPDIVIFVNGIALSVLELKRSSVSIGEGIRQNLDNQQPEFIEWFFSTIQLVMAGSTSEGIRYGTVGTKAKHYMEWQEEAINEHEEHRKLARHLRQLCAPERFLEIVHDFMLFDSGIKKICRQNQYFAVKAVQKHIHELTLGRDSHNQLIWREAQNRPGGIIWHTQGAGKSLIMAMLWRWIKSHDPKAKLLIATDRTELDEQIKKNFLGVDLAIERATSGSDLVAKLLDMSVDAICSLIHKFGSPDEKDDGSPGKAEDFIKELKTALGNALPNRNLYVYIDECHRTQSGELHKAMQQMLPGAMMIGFTGTPLLKSDKPSVQVFGKYLHKYLFTEAARDKVVLDLRYEARNIEQELSNPEKIDAWFEAKTAGLSRLGKNKLMKEWASKQRVLSSKSRIGKIAQDIIFDFGTKPRLLEGNRGNAILVANSIYEACQYLAEFNQSDLKGKVAIVTSYAPTPDKIKGETTGDGSTQQQDVYRIYTDEIVRSMDCKPSEAASMAEEYEKKAKNLFVNEPENMKLLIVVDKLLTGFDAPSATYLYIDKPMQDHGLFQAICRTNRPDPMDETKDYGYIVDYRNLFGKIKDAMTDFASGALSGYDAIDVDGLLKDFEEDAYYKVKAIRTEIQMICAGVQGTTSKDFKTHFCPSADADSTQQTKLEQKRPVFYKTAEAYLRAVVAMGSALESEFGEKAASVIRQESKFYEAASKEVKIASGDFVDMKIYEPQMKRLIDQYIDASTPTTLAGFEDLSLLEMVTSFVDNNHAVTDAANSPIEKGNEQSIVANVRALLVKSTTISQTATGKMSELLKKLLDDLNADAIDYKAFLQQIAEMVKQIKNPSLVSGYPSSIKTKSLQDLYSLFHNNEAPSLAVDAAIRLKLQPMWRSMFARRKKIEIEVEQAVRAAYFAQIGNDPDLNAMVVKTTQDVMVIADANAVDYPS